MLKRECQDKMGLTGRRRPGPSARESHARIHLAKVQRTRHALPRSAPPRGKASRALSKSVPPVHAVLLLLLLGHALLVVRALLLAVGLGGGREGAR